MCERTAYRDRVIGGSREIVPEGFHNWSWVYIRTVAGTQQMHLRMHAKDGPRQGLLVETNAKKSVQEFADPQLRKEFYRVVRETLNEFQFGRADIRPKRGGTLIELGIEAKGRWITIEYNKDAGVPVEILERISKIVKMSGS